MKTLLSLYTLRLPALYAYMLQQVEYDPNKFVSWIKRLFISNATIKNVVKRQKLVITKRATLLILFSSIFTLIVVGGYVFLLRNYVVWWIDLVAILMASPLILTLFMWIITFLAHKTLIVPEQKKLVAEASKLFAKHTGVKIAVLGSYGKTTMKELLVTVLSEGKKVAATPGNKNVSVSHARFARSLDGDEDVVVVEFGEGEPGDIARMANMLKPDYAIITGLAPNHLDHYPDLKSVADDLLDIYKYVDPSRVFVSGESKMMQEFLPAGAKLFKAEEVLGWKTSSVKPTINGIDFQLKKADKMMILHSGLIGRYQVAPISLVASIADKLGLNIKDIESGVRKTAPFEHRMQPRLVHGAWLIDDAYNGNLEGMQAGLDLLAELDFKRKWYVTPGLVDQGVETIRVHQELGKAIAECNPDIVVLMENSARPLIEESMKSAGYKGELRVETNPLEFYSNIEQLLAVGDVVLMQNDWTDNYN